MADNIGFKVVPADQSPHGGPGLLIEFVYRNDHYQPVLLVGHDIESLRRLPATLTGALTALPAPAGEVRCPGCTVQLHGQIAARGACLTCFPVVEVTP